MRVLPSELVKAHLGLSGDVIARLPRTKPVIAAGRCGHGFSR